MNRQAPAVRSTRQRAAVSTLLGRIEDFRTAQEIHEELRRNGDSIGLTTVYRSLQALADTGEVDVLRTASGEAMYRRCATATHHHHLVCRRCGTTVEIEGPAVESWTPAGRRAQRILRGQPHPGRLRALLGLQRPLNPAAGRPPSVLRGALGLRVSAAPREKCGACLHSECVECRSTLPRLQAGPNRHVATLGDCARHKNSPPNGRSYRLPGNCHPFG